MHKENTYYLRVIFIQNVYTYIHIRFICSGLYPDVRVSGNGLTQKFGTNKRSLTNSYGCFVAKVQGVLFLGLRKNGCVHNCAYTPEFFRLRLRTSALS